MTLRNESALQASVEELTRRATALAERGRRTVLGITGCPGSGKSTLATTIVDRLGADRAVAVSMDGFHLSNRVLEELGRSSRKGAIDTFDAEGYAALLDRIAHAQAPDPPVYAPAFHRELEESIAAEIEVVSTVPLVVTEGNYLLAPEGAWPRARRHLTEVWFLEPPDPLRRARLAARHESYGRSPEEAAAWTNGPDEDNARAIALWAGSADLRVEVVG